MNIITKRTILYYAEQYPVAKVALVTWLNEFGRTNFENFNELKQVYGNASLIANHRVIFNIKGNDFRLIVSINFRTQAGYIIWFGSHKEYDKINAAEIKHIEV
jgi:mRNA interferase HigB|nr:type II toxin-antitoxin system HigB family toxin [uncultured Pedobacter sp.]